ncbi:Ig-like domain-containing protein, partial [Tenebrionibacter intestinalis]
TETDAAGNTSEPSPGITIEVDTTPPNADALAITRVDDTVGEITGNIVNGGKTDDSRPTISGTGTAGDTLVLYTTDSSGKHEIGRVTVDASGNWSIQPENPLLAGENIFSAVEIDKAGNSATSPNYVVTLFVEGPSVPSIGSIVDNEGPITGGLQKGDVTDDNTPTLSGSAGVGDIVRIYDNGELIGSTKADESGNWSFTPSRPLDEGDHSLSVTAVDSVGMVSDPSGEFDFSVDTQAPAPVKDLTANDNEGDVQGPIGSGSTTDDATPTLKGSAEPGSTVNIYDDGKKIGEAAVGEDGTWSWTPDDSLEDGERNITVTVSDPAGNESEPSEAIVIVVDTVAPTAQITHVVDSVGSVTGNITPNGVTDDTRPVINGIAKANSVIKVYDGETLLGSTTSDASGNWSFKPVSELEPGSHNLTVTATDLAGNTSDRSGAFVFDIDTTSPVKPTIDSAEDDVGDVRDPLSNGSVTDDSTPTLHGTAEADSVVTIYDNGKVLGSVTTDSDGQWIYTPTTPLPEGEHHFTVTATDAAGNKSADSDEFVLTTDYTAPDASKLAITGVEDNVGEITGNILSGGNTDDNTPVITGTGTAGNTISIYTTVNGTKTLLGKALVDENGQWRLELDDSNALSGGMNSLTAVETDPAGNSTSPTPAYVINVYLPGDGPSAPSINSVHDNEGTQNGPLQKGSVTDDNTP